jgi:hypothetical protein
MGLIQIIVLNLILKIIPLFTSVEENTEAVEDFSKNNTVTVSCNPAMTSETNDIHFQNLS